ncbi:hypothetical protein CP532_4693 [Ophiocordyceps camponoti-leonardi (nom. inval.)]|nr:hypothetical protein CP532_4693 [Ophiocordyceps camponoti-leonardi (nom. inval.)]
MRQRQQKSAPYHHHQYDDDDDDDDDELSFEPLEIRIKRDAAYRLSLERAHADNRFQATMAHIFEKYGRDFDGIGDEIDLMTGEILVDNGHLQNMRDEGDVGVANGFDHVPDVSMEDLVHGNDDDLFSSLAPAQRRDPSTSQGDDDDEDEEDRIMSGRKADPQSLSLLSQPPPQVPDDGLSSLTGLFGTARPPVFGASTPLGFGASPFAMEPWTMSDPFGFSPWDPPRLFPSPTDRYHFPSQDGGNSIWQPGYRFKDDEAVGQFTTPPVLARVRPDVRTKPMKYMLPSSASKPDDAQDQEEIDEDAILMGTAAPFSQLEAPTSTHMEMDELVMPLPQEVMPPTDTQTDSTTTETDEAPPPKRPRLALTSAEQPTRKQQQRLVVELKALPPSLRHEYMCIDEAAAEEPADDRTPSLDTTKPALSLNENDETKTSSQGRSDVEGRKETAAPEGNVLRNEQPTTTPSPCLSDDEMPISLPKPKAKQAAASRQSTPPQRTSPPPEAPSASVEDSTPVNIASSPAEEVSTRARRSKKAIAEAKPNPKPNPQQVAIEKSTSPPPGAPSASVEDSTPTNVASPPAEQVSTQARRSKPAKAKPKSTSPPPKAQHTPTKASTQANNIPSSPTEKISSRSLRAQKPSTDVNAEPTHLAPEESPSPHPASSPTNDPGQQAPTRTLRSKKAIAGIWKSTSRTGQLLRTPVKRRPTIDVAMSPGSVVETPGGTVRTCGLDGYRCGRDFCFSCL